MILDNWTKKDYQSFLDLLENNIDLDYQQFHKNLLNSDINFFGVRTPILKNIASYISKGNYNEFITLNQHNSYEEIIIHGLIIGYVKEDINIIRNMLDNFIPYINNWAINDIVAANMKVFKNEQEAGFIIINEYLKSNNNWTIRFGLILLLDHYINDKYINKLLDISCDIKSDDYYVKMAISWLLSICYIKYPDTTESVFKRQVLDKWTNNKAIQKIRESYRVTAKQKESLIKYKM
jgi:3-methyladenine DNA glycosylase AlkD